MRDPNLGSIQLEAGDTTGIKTLEDLVRFVRDRDLRVTAAVQALAAGHIDVSYAAPLKPRDGDWRIADGINWNPLGTGIKRPVWFDGVTNTWKAF